MTNFIICEMCGQRKTGLYCKSAACTNCPNQIRKFNSLAKPHYVYVARYITNDSTAQTTPLFKIGKSNDHRNALETLLNKTGNMEIIIFQEFLNDESAGFADEIFRERFSKFAITIQDTDAPGGDI
jgi:hypothetical protein